MIFDRSFAIVTISPLEPALLLSLVLSTFVAWLAGKGLGSLTKRIVDPWRRAIYIGPLWFFVGLALFILPNVFVVWAYPALHPEDRDAMVCVAMAWPTFILPTLVGYFAASVVLRRGSRLAAA